MTKAPNNHNLAPAAVMKRFARAVLGEVRRTYSITAYSTQHISHNISHTTMAIWFHDNITCEALNKSNAGTMGEHVGIEYITIGEDYLEATMPVDHRTKQPAGLLHGGASLVLAETLGSIGAFLCIDMTKFTAVGLEINANHIRSATSGHVRGVARPLHRGGRTQVWEIKIYADNTDEHLVCVSRITMAILERK
jgi:1,4-dihydroxy-2-naphthoyl-CoA hydrolase